VDELFAYFYDAWMVALVDGDTLHCGVDLGLDVSINLTIRLYGINAPEMSTPEGKEAKAFAAKWLESNCPDGRFVLRTIKDRREKYGRYLGVVMANGATLNDDMVSSGHAVEYLPK
jgi:micrococcal nuclease